MVINKKTSKIYFCLSLHYNSFLFVKDTKIYQFKAKYFEMKRHPLSLGNISGDFSTSNMKKDRIKWVCLRFFC